MENFISEQVIELGIDLGCNLTLELEDVIQEDYIFTLTGDNDSVKLLVNRTGQYLEIFPIDEVKESIQTIEFSTLSDAISALKVYMLYREKCLVPVLSQI